MNKHLQTILNSIQHSMHLSIDEKNILLKAVKDADKEMEITAFKLDRTEKVKRTTGILLEETIEELEQKRKAVEAQNRELGIESSLERVRTVAMSMNKRDDMLHVCRVISEQLQNLNVQEIRNVQTAIFYETKGTYINYEFYTKHDKTLITEVEYKNHAVQSGFAEQMLKGPNEIFIHSFNGKEVQDWYEFQKTTNVFLDTYLETADSLNYYWYSLGPVALGISTYKALNEKETKLFKRFVKVFELSYRRYLDIEKAEAQAKESQIQLALERVRARTMAMQKSDELSDAVFILFQQFRELGENPDQATIGIINEDEKVIEYWVTMYGNPINKVFKFSLDEPNVTNKIYTAWKENKKSLVIGLSGKTLSEFMTYRANKGGAAINPNEKRRVINVAFFSKGLLNVQSNEERSKESIQLLERFAMVFQQTYTRFLDLQKAEAQARESQIEAALERVRSRTMAMQKQNDLLGVLDLLVEQLVKLGVNLQVANFSNGIPGGDWDLWIEVAADDGTIFNNYVHFPRIDHPYFHHVEKNIEIFRKDGTDLFKDVFSKEEKDSWQDYINTQTIYKDLTSEEIKQSIYEKPGYAWSMVILKDAWVSICRFSTIPFSGQEDAVLRRFAKVFEQTYTRFLDLQKAEEQAKEAQIELSLERVRAKTMAMHNSADVAETAAVMVEELKKLEIETIRCGISVMHEPGDMEVWTISTGDNNKTDIIIGWLDMNMHPLLHGAFESWRNKIEAYSYELKDDDLLNYYNAINNYPNYPIRYDPSNLPEKINHNEFYFAEGTLFAFSIQQLTEGHRKIFKRFAAVFGQTYRRYLDLQKAEAQAREAQIETALERVRSRTLAMQKSDELAETAAVLFNQLVLLGIEPNRLYIGIIKDDNGQIEFWATDEEGIKVSTRFIGDANRNISMKKMYDAWKAEKKSLTIDMKGKELTDYFEYMVDELKVPFTTGLSQKRRIQNIAIFGKGFLGIASPDDQSEETIHLLERFAAVFNLTYTRFNDLQIAEAHAVQAAEDLIKLQTEKRRAEDALNELQATQKQLIQSEKMASLGELTAGIAHEIQNPLNFVNNFSEVSNELLDEMNIEIENGDIEEAKAIANDIKQNLEKINHHGKRADAIVKGMLQHSRSSTGAKEPTDINALADEYLRLSYHGLRAKDKSFNAGFKTDFDTSVQRIDIVPQDIGRVLLNLYNNAFYAVNEKSKNFQPLKGSKEYQPTITVSTKSVKFPSGDLGVLLTVTDNGNGIPSSLKDKIFQPFFTTKPTGQGTGLGLSLSYDIIKAHRGEIKVETKEGEGSEFIIQLTINTN